MKDNQRKQQILRAGRDCFLRFGFDKTTLEDIGKLAGLNKASLYYYFKNKEEIYLEVVLTESQAFIADLKAKALAYPDVRKQIRFYLTERMRRYSEIMQLTGLSTDNRIKLEFMLEEVYQQCKSTELAFLTDLLKKGVGNNAFSLSEPSSVTAETFFLLTDALKHETLRRSPQAVPGEIDFTESTELMDRILKMALR